MRLIAFMCFQPVGVLSVREVVGSIRGTAYP